MEENIFEQKRNSYMEPVEIFFWTATINRWNHLLKDDRFKDVIIDSLNYLSDKGKIDVFAFIMPNHIHIITAMVRVLTYQYCQNNFLFYINLL